MDAFVTLLKSHPRELHGDGTAIGDAILYGAQSLTQNAFEGKRRIVDSSGDGPDRNGMPAAMGRDEALKLGVTIKSRLGRLSTRIRP